MSILEFYSRPLVQFDADNKDHRQYYYQFLEKWSWGRCPYRFIIPDGHGGDLITLIQRKMLEFYINKEFKVGGRPKQSTVAKPQKTVSQKKVKLVDSQAV